MTEKNRPLRVLQVIGIVCGGGVEAVIMNYYRHIDRSRVQFDFVVDGYERSILDDEIEALGGRVYHVCPYKKNILTYMREIYGIVKGGGYQIVHSNMNTLTVFSLLAARLAGARVRICHNHSTAVKGEGARAVMKYILRPFAPLFATHRLACSELAARWMYGDRAVERGEIKLVRNAIDLSRYAYDEKKRTRLRAELGIPEGALVVGHVGRFAFPKNHEFLLAVFAEVLKSRPDAHLVLIGTGELETATRDRAAELGIAASTHFLGLRTDAYDYYSVMDAFVFPSRFEGLGLVAIEAQAGGLPALCSTAVPPEAILLDTASRLDLSAGPTAWADAIIAATSAPRTATEIAQVKLRAYDITSAAEELTEFYTALTM